MGNETFYWDGLGCDWQPGCFFNKPARQEVSGQLTRTGKYFMYSHVKCAGNLLKKQKCIHKL